MTFSKYVSINDRLRDHFGRPQIIKFSWNFYPGNGILKKILFIQRWKYSTSSLHKAELKNQYTTQNSIRFKRNHTEISINTSNRFSTNLCGQLIGSGRISERKTWFPQTEFPLCWDALINRFPCKFSIRHLNKISIICLFSCRASIKFGLASANIIVSGTFPLRVWNFLYTISNTNPPRGIFL